MLEGGIERMNDFYRYFWEIEIFGSLYANLTYDFDHPTLGLQGKPRDPLAKMERLDMVEIGGGSNIIIAQLFHGATKSHPLPAYFHLPRWRCRRAINLSCPREMNGLCPE